MPLPPQNVQSRGWDEDFWVRVTERCARFLRGVVDNPLIEARLNCLNQGDEIVVHEDHILAIHDIHRQDLAAEMDEGDLKELTLWLASLRK